MKTCKAKKMYGLAIMLFSIMLVSPTYAQNGPKGTLRVGAAKVDITPNQDELPPNSFGILDHIHSRAIVIDNNHTKAALVTVDIGGISDAQWKTITERVETEIGIPQNNIMITASHTHSGARLKPEVLNEKIFSSIKEATSKLQPAQIGYGSGVSYININRNIFDQERHGWWEGPNYEGISDKTVAVICFKTMDNKPIAVYYNYAMHAVAAGQLDMISGDVPGTTSKYIEDTFDNEIIAVWSTGASGDQNPIYFNQTYELRDIRIKEYAKRGEDISNAMPPGGTGLDRNNPQVAKLMQQQKDIIISMGQMLGEEVQHVMRNIKRYETVIPINTGSKIITCPGRNRLNKGRAGYEGKYEGADPIELRLGLIMLDNIPITSVNAEIFNYIAVRLKNESPYTRTMMATITNGTARSGYIPNDAAYGFQTFEVLSSRLKPGYAESAIVNGLLDLINEATH